MPTEPQQVTSQPFYARHPEEVSTIDDAMKRMEATEKRLGLSEEGREQ